MIKLGGSLDGEFAHAAADIRDLVAAGCPVVVVHGGGAASDQLGAELGRTKRYLTASNGRRSRYTDADALDSLTLGMLGRVKPVVVTGLLALGVRAVGLSGLDAGLLTARRTPPVRVRVDGVEQVVRDDRSGRIEAVDPHLLQTLLAAGYVPVISPPGLDPVAGPLNVDADRFAAAVATALGAHWLIVLSNVPGLLRDQEQPGDLVTELPCEELPHYLEMAGGRMKVKLRSACEARLGGVRNVVLADGRVPHPVMAARAVPEPGSSRGSDEYASREAVTADGGDRFAFG